MSALPTLAEVPPVSNGRHRDMEELLRLGLIPAEDVKLRAAAIADFIADERDNDTPGGPPDPEAFTKRRKGFSEIGAQTPGGIAWKIATALDFWKEEENWDWWRYLLYSALIDAADLERRRVAKPSDPPQAG
jgi:hypothetical protein